MDAIDRQIARIIQREGRTSSGEIAERVGVSVSTANERVRRLASTGVIKAWRAVLDPSRLGAGLCGFMMVDMAYTGEEEAKAALAERPEVQELHHVSGPHSYLLKVRVADTSALQKFLQEHVKPLKAVQRTETIVVLETVKETTEMLIVDPRGDGE
jgi:Lrp/AsnC family leucine-responsive transcriptional regulator